MTGFELRVARELLGLTQQEAAEHIGNVSQRSWAHWESGGEEVKEDVAKTINFLLERRREIIRQFVNGQHEIGEAKKIAIVYYPTPDYCNGILEWRFSQSLARTLALDFGATLVEFDYDEYTEFLLGFNLEDTQAHRSEWAAYKITK